MGPRLIERAIGYLCAPTEAAAGEASARLERWATGASVQLEDVFQDVSPALDSSILERQGFAAALRHLHRHRHPLLVIGHPGELGPRPLAWPLAQALVTRLGARLCAAHAAEPVQTRMVRLSLGELSDTFHRLIEFERRLPIKARMEEKGVRGERRGRHPPYGFRLSSDGKRLEPDERERAMMSEAARLRAAGDTYREIGVALMAAGFQPRSAKRWHTTTIRKLVARAGELS